MEDSQEAVSVPRRLGVDNLTERGLLQTTPPQTHSAATGNFATAGCTTIPSRHPNIG